MSTEYLIEIPFTVSVERVGDLLCSALEGGSTYWCAAMRPESYPDGTEWGHQAIAHGTPFRVLPDDDEWIQVDNSPDRIRDTLVLMARKYPRAWFDFIRENDDAYTGDLFFQLLVFGEEVYG